MAADPELMPLLEQSVRLSLDVFFLIVVLTHLQWTSRVWLGNSRGAIGFIAVGYYRLRLLN